MRDINDSFDTFLANNKAGVALLLLIFVVLVYTYVVIKYQVGQTWKQYIEDISTFIPLAGVIAGALIGVIDLFMLLSDYYFDRKQKRIAEAKAEAYVEGGAQFYAKVKNWNDRRIEAESNGEDFDEPMPTPQNIQVSTPVEKTSYDHAADDATVK